MSEAERQPPYRVQRFISPFIKNMSKYSETTHRVTQGTIIDITFLLC